MREHRLIERMLDSLFRERESALSGRINPAFIDSAVDFFRTYADRTHHGKEENILFAELAKKDLKPEHKRVVDELLEEHKVARKTVRSLIEAKERCIIGDVAAAGDVERLLGDLIALYPPHITKEDKHFFFPTIEYFTASERADMLRRFYEFDQTMIHQKYATVVDAVGAEKKP